MQANIPDAVMHLRAEIPDSAMTAKLLGTEREGLAVRLRSDGVALTVGYLCLEAQDIWLTNRAGETSRAHVVAQDTDSGLALVRPEIPLGGEVVEIRTLNGIDPGQSLRVVNHTADAAMACNVIAIGEFSGRWEYLLEKALYTVPACDNWGGAALLDDQADLVGIGSLFLELPGAGGASVYGNLFVPAELIAPHVEDLCLHGARKTPPRPWMGWMIQQVDEKLMVVGIYPNGPAQTAGINIEEIITAVNGQPVHEVAELFRAVFRSGDAGTRIPVTVMRKGSEHEVVVHSVDRNGFFQQRHGGAVN
jgi:S1-C subfamily serine protease